MKNKYIKYLLIPCLLLVSGLNNAFAQNTITVKGTVVDEDNLPLVGVSISNDSRSIGTITDIDGKFTLQTVQGEILTFSYMGYNSVKDAAKPEMNIRLSVDAVQLDAVTIVGVGYGTMRKSDLTGAITSVQADDLKQGIITSAEQLLQGKVAGLTVVQRSGDPTQGASLRLRGGTSLTASNDPLIVVDGIPGVDFNTINPNEIVSIDVLKDASATAIFGSRGANGVIIVTTNREKAGRQISYNAYFAVSNAAKNMDLLSANQWREYVRANPETMGGAVDYGGDTDWQREIQRTGYSQNHVLSFASAGDKNGLRANIAYQNTEGVIKTSSLERLSAGVTAFQYGLNDRLKIEASLHANRDTYHPVNMGIYERAYNLNPTLPVKENEVFTQIGGTNNNNAVELLMNAQDDQSRVRLLAYVKAELEIIDGLKGVINTSYEYNTQQGRYYRPSYAYDDQGVHGYGRRTLGDYDNKQMEIYLTYDKTFSDIHRLNVMGGYSYLIHTYEGFGAERRGFDTDAFTYNNLASGTDFRTGDVYSYKGEAKLISFFGRANYALMDRYIATATLRRDGSSRFGANHPWGTFPSASVAWRISDETFMESTREWLNNLKLRAGWGVTGNQDGIGEYKSLALMATRDGENRAIGTYYDQATDSWKNAYGYIQNPNPELRWESTAQTNIGLDITFLRNFNITLDLYEKKTYDLLYTYPVPQPPYLYDRMLANVGDLNNKGIELAFGANLIHTKDFNWNANLTLAHNAMKVVKLSDELYQIDVVQSGNLHGLTGMSGLMTQILAEGYPVGTFWGPKCLGIDENGKFIFEKDADGNVINQNLGSAQPKLSLGFAMDFRYRDFDLAVSTYGMFGQKILNAQKMNMTYPGRLPAYNVLDSELHSKITEGPVFSDYWIEKGDFLRLQSLTFGYTLPVVNRWFQKIRFYVTGENLWVITGYTGLDPEVNIAGLKSPGIDKSIGDSGIGDNYYYPRPRTFSFGLNLVF
jgi:iron complex outermembrane receptor protein